MPTPEEVIRPYREAVDQHGAGFAATLWGSRDAQQLRFRVMIDLAGFDACHVLDVGCGTGDFAEALIEQSVAFRQYTGIDALPEVIDAATARGLDRSTFRVSDVLATPDALATVTDEPFDFACFSGSLNTMDEVTARALVGSAFEAAAQGVVFNFLSNRPHPRYAGRDTTPARRFDTADWIAWALSMTSRVQFTQEYLDGHDATILMRHDDRDDVR